MRVRTFHGQISFLVLWFKLQKLGWFPEATAAWKNGKMETISG
jgi:hypothetical protein